MKRRGCGGRRSARAGAGGRARPGRRGADRAVVQRPDRHHRRHGTLVNSTCVATWSGAAEALQGTSRLRADVIRAFLKKKPPADPATGAEPAPQTDCGATERIEADGHVYYVTPDQVARGDHAVYTADADKIVMTGNVIVVQGKNVVRGDRLTIQVATRQVDDRLGRQGRGTPGAGARRASIPTSRRGAGAALPGRRRRRTARRWQTPPQSAACIRRDHRRRASASGRARRRPGPRWRSPGWDTRAWWSTGSASRSAAARWSRTSA